MIRKTNRGKSILHHNGYEYHLNKARPTGTKNWRCTKYSSCKGTCTTHEGEEEFPIERQAHSPPPNPEKCEVARMVSYLKQKEEADFGFTPM